MAAHYIQTPIIFQTAPPRAVTGRRYAREPQPFTDAAFSAPGGTRSGASRRLRTEKETGPSSGPVSRGTHVSYGMNFQFMSGSKLTTLMLDTLAPFIV